VKELFDFPHEMQQTFKLLSVTRERLEADMYAGMAASGGYNDKHMVALEKLATAMSKLGTELRQWSGHQKSSLDKMPPARKAQVCIQFIQNELPIGPRADLYRVLAGLEAKRGDGVELLVNSKFGSAPATGDE
jgi:hypothetical protein